jgi:hypothetical protein
MTQDALVNDLLALALTIAGTLDEWCSEDMAL